MTIVSKEQLLAKRAETVTGFPQETVTIPGVGDVLVRGLSRFEVLHIDDVANNVQTRERKAMHLGLVDPALTEAEVGQLQKVSVAGELTELNETILRLSGMDKKAAKAAYKKFEEDPGSEFRVLPGAEAEQDGSGVEDGPATAAE